MPRSTQRRRADATGDDAALIERSRKGDTSAFEGLMAKYANLVGSIAFNIIGDVHVAGDITQDTFLKVYRNLANLEDPRRFKGWLCMIARTTCVDWLRKERLKPASLEKIAEDGVEPEGEFLGAVFKQTSTELEELREKILHIGLPIATIESRLYRARIMLKDKLMDLYC
jgi:RNA polymerase sigma-70 factor (ECF subfamily)